MTDEEYQNATNAFLAWLPQIGVKMNPKMAVVDMRGNGRGRGVVALEAFAQDEIVFSIPRASVLTINNGVVGHISRTTSLTEEGVANIPSWLSLTLVMMAELLQSQSQWSPYFAVLPATLDSLVFWTPDELAELQASAVLSKIGKESAEAMFYKGAEAFGLEGSLVDLFHKTASTIMAYAFDIPGEEPEEGYEEETVDDLVPDDDHLTLLSMIPLADLLNADAERNNVRLSCDNQDLEMRTIKPIKKGEEILNDYGPLPRSDLLRRYGYITDMYSQYDVVEITTDFITSFLQNCRTVDGRGWPYEQLSTRQWAARLDLARREDVFEDTYDISHASDEGPCIPDELIALLYLLLANEETLSSIERSDAVLPSRSKMCTKLLGSLMLQLLSSREQQYKTTLEEDEEILTNEKCSPRKFAAVKVRQGEKAVLREALLEAQSFQGDNKRMRLQSGKRAAEEGISSPMKKGRTF